MVHVVSVHGHHGSVHYNIISIIYNAINTDSARIRPFFKALSGHSQCS